MGLAAAPPTQPTPAVLHRHSRVKRTAVQQQQRQQQEHRVAITRALSSSSSGSSSSNSSGRSKSVEGTEPRVAPDAAASATPKKRGSPRRERPQQPTVAAVTAAAAAGPAGAATIPSKAYSSADGPYPTSTSTAAEAAGRNVRIAHGGASSSGSVRNGSTNGSTYGTSITSDTGITDGSTNGSTNGSNNGSTHGSSTVSTICSTNGSTNGRAPSGSDTPSPTPPSTREPAGRTMPGTPAAALRQRSVPRRNPYARAPEVPPAVFEYLNNLGPFLEDPEGPPRFFCPVEASPKAVADDVIDDGDGGVEGRDAALVLPRLFFLPGIEGTGFGLRLHHKSLARLFEVTCLHVPTGDRTPFLGLVELVEKELREEHARSPDRALFMVGESFGGILALAVAARNPDLPITLVLVNPATAFPRSPLLPLLPLLQLMPDELYSAVPFLFSFTMGNPVKMASAGIPIGANPIEAVLQIRENLLRMIPALPTLSSILPRDTLMWKVQLLEEGARIVEPLLSSVKFPTLILASGEDNMLPSVDEAKRLKAAMTSASKRIVRTYDGSGHTLLLEADLDLGSVIKGAGLYRHRASGKLDPITDGFVAPTVEEVARVKAGLDRTIRQLCSPVFLSTTKNGRVVHGLTGLPDLVEAAQRPILFVGNHQTYAPDMSVIVGEVLEKRGYLLRGLAHPMALGMFDGEVAGQSDVFRVFGAVPVTPANTYKLLANGECVLLFPGGAREALKGRGEQYKLLWPSRPEIIRMAARFGATIIPYAAVGVDDGYNYILDGEEILQTPYLGERAREFMDAVPKVRTSADGDAEDRFVAPIVAPKQVNRLYFLFRKPIYTHDKPDLLADKDAAADLYRHLKSEVQGGLDYILTKREDDPYKDLWPRLVYEASWGWTRQAPTFDL